MTDEQLAAARAREARILTARACSGLLGLAGVSLCLMAIAAASLGGATWLLREHGWALALLWGGVAWLWGRLAYRCAACLFRPNDLPEGIPLSRQGAPSLYRLADEVGAHFGGWRVDAIWITPDMNAAVLQRPRWGLVGPMQTHLLVGLALAQSVSEPQLRAILAHEYGHLHCQRRALAAWGCHVRSWWFRVIEACAERVPVLGAWLEGRTWQDVIRARELARLEEFEADRAAARLAGPAMLAETLVDVAVKGDFLVHDYWAKVMSQCTWRAEPVIRPYREMRSGMLAGFSGWSGRRDCLQAMFSEAAAAEDLLHPSVAERLEALGERPRHTGTVATSAAERHLSALLPTLTWAFDYHWWLSCRHLWQQSYRQAAGADEPA